MNFRNRSVVITGASSGLGRATAHGFAREGAKLTLLARNASSLENTVLECRNLGGEAMGVAADVRDEHSVASLAKLAVEAYGAIDVWVNNAAVVHFGSIDEEDFDMHRDVLETNLFGFMYGCRAAMPVFKAQKHGVLINVSSVLGKVGHPFVPSYVVSNFAARGLTESLRVALADYPDIHICTLFPFAIDTAHLETSEKIAHEVIGLARRPRPEKVVPGYMSAAIWAKSLFPHTTDVALLHILKRYYPDKAQQPTKVSARRALISSAVVSANGASASKLLPVLGWGVMSLVTHPLEHTLHRLRRGATRIGQMRARRRAA